VGGGLTLLFLAGQLAAWQQMSSSGYLMRSNPAVAFFYMLTAVHGLHLLGGLLVWGRTLVRMWAGAELVDIHLSVKLCSIYWHYLLLVWLVLFALLLYT
jgi:cytochrome c oxidase subunit 3